MEPICNNQRSITLLALRQANMQMDGMNLFRGVLPYLGTTKMPVTCKEPHGGPLLAKSGTGCQVLRARQNGLFGHIFFPKGESV